MSHSAPMARFRKSIHKRQTCSPYTSPAEGTTLSAYEPVTFTWDPNCLQEVNLIDIYLYDLEEGKSENGPIFSWKDVPTRSGQFDAQIYANWYNATDAGDETMRLQFVSAGDPAWATTMAVGPQFTVNWNGTAPPSSVTTNDNFDNTAEPAAARKKDHSVSGGKLAAAVAIPLLAVILCLIGYLVWSRKKGKSTDKRWSGVVQKRMSQMSQAPSFVPSHQANNSRGSYAFSANRNSFAGSNHSPLRNSAFFASARPSGESMREAGNRTSRISFATSPSPTKESKRPTSISYPKIGRNGDVLSPLSPEQDTPPVLDFRTHRAQKSSMASSLRNEVSNSETEGALSVIAGTQRLSRLGMEEEVIDSSNDLARLASGGSEGGHSRQMSEGSLKMPKMNRQSLSPDQALEAYSQSKIAAAQPKKNFLSFLSPSPSKQSVQSMNSTRSTPTLPGDEEESFMTPSQSSVSLTFTPGMLNQPSPAILRPTSAYSSYSQTSGAQEGLGINSMSMDEQMFAEQSDRRESLMADTGSHHKRASDASGFYAR